MVGGTRALRFGAVLAMVTAAGLAFALAIDGAGLPPPQTAAVAALGRHLVQSGPRLLAGGAERRLPHQPGPPAWIIPVGRQQIRVPILMYHYIRVNPVPGDVLGFNLSVTPADFAAQMGWLAAGGYTPIDLEELRYYLGGRMALPARPVVLTFDDGYQDFYTTAFPILHQHGFKAVAYIVAGFLGRRGYMTADEVVQLDALGVEIGAHTVSHLDLTKLSGPSLHHEVADSRAMLEGLVKHPVVDFCYPSGRENGQVVAEVQADGFQSATTTAPGTDHSLGNRFTWTRVRVSGGEGLVKFVESLGPDEPYVPNQQTPTAPEPQPTAAGVSRLDVRRLSNP